MSISLEDGKGSGRLAKVNIDNELVVRSVATTQEHEVSHEEGKAFFANTTDTANTLTITATGGPILYLENTSDEDLIIQKVVVSNDTAAMTMVWYKNMTIGTIGNNNTHTPVNLNFKSGRSASVICYNWDEVGDGMTGLSNGTKIKTFIMATGMEFHPLEGAIILGKGDNFVIQAHGAGEFEAGIRFYYDFDETVT